ncbi:uncharacterized protein LOC133822892 [Humulus lupulus]|uniref:uncharacterized protein LOC133822892 n=1 Tax=Humulus lupulus TaxID=3486 RepID=UPI002B417420|nr:uncharacterized protein LOC133822892 [Humulus lupulus]
MWGFASNAISSIGLKKSLILSSQACSECSDDDVCSNSSREEGLECPICWESFNIVENVPYVLWCGHTLCKHCVLGLQWAVIKFPTQQFKVPLFISCPWCHLLSLRLIYKGNLKFPRKNFFLLWMVESLNGDRVKFGSSFPGENQQVLSYNGSQSPKNPAHNVNLMSTSFSSCCGLTRYNDNDGSSHADRNYSSLHKSIDFFIHFTSKFSLVIIFLLIVFFVIPGSAVILAIYFVLTVLFAIPSFLVLYFAYPTIQRLVREITSRDIIG